MSLNDTSAALPTSSSSEYAHGAAAKSLSETSSAEPTGATPRIDADHPPNICRIGPKKEELADRFNDRRRRPSRHAALAISRMIRGSPGR